jgi:two-component system, OmpR family, sensor kinase
MGERTSQAVHDFESMKTGGHVCLSHRSSEEKYDALASFILGGVVRGERCLLWGDASEFSAATPHLEGRGVPVSALRERSALQFLGPKPAGVSDPEGQTAAIRAAVVSARSEGYTGLRVAGLGGARAGITPEQLGKFERHLSALYRESHATGLCVFDQTSTEPALIELALCTHEAAIVGGRLCPNPFFSFPYGAPEPGRALDRVEWMSASILHNAERSEATESQSAALIVEGSRVGQRDAAYRREIATLRRAVEARDRLIVTAARWLARPLPAMCGQLDELLHDQRLSNCHHGLDACSEHLAAMTRLSRGLDEIASFVQMQVVLRPEQLDLMAVARAAMAEVNDDATAAKVAIKLEGPASVMGSWDRLRVGRLFCSLLQTARDQGFDSKVHLRVDDLPQFVRIRLEFTLPHAPSLSDSGERVRSLAFGDSSESDYDRLAVQLWSSREIVRMMGGTLGISTWADARVIFTLDLPKFVAEDSISG